VGIQTKWFVTVPLSVLHANEDILYKED